MGQTLEERVSELEREIAALKAKFVTPAPKQKDWRCIVGAFRDDETSREADRLGREYREQQRQQ